MTAIWLKVSADVYELPLAVADSAKELAGLCGISLNGLFSYMSRCKKEGRDCIYKKILVEEEN